LKSGWGGAATGPACERVTTAVDARAKAAIQKDEKRNRPAKRIAGKLTREVDERESIDFSFDRIAAFLSTDLKKRARPAFSLKSALVGSIETTARGRAAITLSQSRTTPMLTPKILRILPFGAIVVLAAWTTGCLSALQRHPASPKIQLANVYRPPVAGDLTRVAVLPLSGDVQPAEALREMDKTFHAEFNKPQVFEGVQIQRQEMEEIIHQDQISSVEPIPQELLRALEEKYGAEAVLFTDITYYRPYRPISISVRTKLVSLKTNEVLWAIDANFDSAEPGVAAAARAFSKLTEQNPVILKASDSSGVLLSPQRFARFVAREIFATLPKRRLPRE